MYYIDKVHYENDVIAEVKYTDLLYSDATNSATKQTIISWINAGHQFKTKYINRNGVWTEGDNIIVVDNRYIRTDGSNIKCDNLGNLPRY